MGALENQLHQLGPKTNGKQEGEMMFTSCSGSLRSASLTLTQIVDVDRALRMQQTLLFQSCNIRAREPTVEGLAPASPIISS